MGITTYIPVPFPGNSAPRLATVLERVAGAVVLQVVVESQVAGSAVPSDADFPWPLDLGGGA